MQMETFEERKLRVIRLLEGVARGDYEFLVDRRKQKWVRQPFISPNWIDTNLPPASAGLPSNTEIRNAAIADSDAQDVAAGRPLLSSVVIDTATMLPRKSFFKVLCERDAVEAKTREDKGKLHTHEYNRALAFPWETVVRGRPRPAVDGLPFPAPGHEPKDGDRAGDEVKLATDR